MNKHIGADPRTMTAAQWDERHMATLEEAHAGDEEAQQWLDDHYPDGVTPVTPEELAGIRKGWPTDEEIAAANVRMEQADG